MLVLLKLKRRLKRIESLKIYDVFTRWFIIPLYDYNLYRNLKLNIVRNTFLGRKLSSS